MWIKELTVQLQADGKVGREFGVETLAPISGAMPGVVGIMVKSGVMTVPFSDEVTDALRLRFELNSGHLIQSGVADVKSSSMPGKSALFLNGAGDIRLVVADRMKVKAPIQTRTRRAAKHRFPTKRSLMLQGIFRSLKAASNEIWKTVMCFSWFVLTMTHFSENRVNAVEKRRLTIRRTKLPISVTKKLVP